MLSLWAALSNLTTVALFSYSLRCRMSPSVKISNEKEIPNTKKREPSWYPSSFKATLSSREAHMASHLPRSRFDATRRKGPLVLLVSIASSIFQTENFSISKVIWVSIASAMTSWILVLLLCGVSQIHGKISNCYLVTVILNGWEKLVLLLLGGKIPIRTIRQTLSYNDSLSETIDLGHPLNVSSDAFSSAGSYSCVTS